MKENLVLAGLIVLILGLCVLGYMAHLDTRTVTFKVDKFSVVMRQKIVDQEGFTAENLPTTFEELSKLQVKEIAWKDYVGVAQGRPLYEWYDWVQKRGFLHKGTPFTI